MTNFKEGIPGSKTSLKKIHNVKTELKQKADGKRTGDKKIVLKTWEESVSNKSGG